jgi:hypothetical protein
VVTELFGLEVDEEFTIPRIIRSDVKEFFVRKSVLTGALVVS